MPKSKARPADTYRAARRNVARQVAKAANRNLRDVWPSQRLRGDLNRKI